MLLLRQVIGPRILLIISGGIAAYKSLELIRRMRASWHVRCIMTKGATEFITPLSVSALSEKNLWRSVFAHR